MDKSKHYIEMCKKAIELNQLKWEYGFIDGDWIYIGREGVRVIGSDTLNVGHSIADSEDGKVAIVELSHGESITFDNNGNDIDVNVLKYPVDSYINPIWLPRQDQLESFYYQAVLERIDLSSWIQELSGMDNLQSSHNFKSMEQIALAIIMDTKFDKHWNGTDWIENEELDDEEPNTKAGKF